MNRQSVLGVVQKEIGHFKCKQKSWQVKSKVHHAHTDVHHQNGIRKWSWKILVLILVPNKVTWVLLYSVWRDRISKRQANRSSNTQTAVVKAHWIKWSMVKVSVPTTANVMQKSKCTAKGGHCNGIHNTPDVPDWNATKRGQANVKNQKSKVN